MAKRRMFSMDVIDTDKFLEMPMSSQLLYFHLAMRADDDGFISSPKRILRLIGASEDDLRVLMSKQYVIPFDSGVCVIRHWKIHNYIQSDRYHKTMYTEEKKQLIEEDNKSYSLYTECIHDVRKMDTEVRLVKDSLGEGSQDNEREETETFLTAYNNISSLPKAIKLTETRKKHIQARIKEHGIEICIQALDKIKASDFLSGKNNQGWKPNLDWIVNQSNMIKILEGAYDNKKGGGDKKRAATIYDDDYYEGSV
jgi:hypothetical protein